MTLQLSSVSAAVSGRTIVSDVTLSAPSGEVLGLVGPNGAGKTTLLRVLTGELPPSRGAVSFRGRELSKYSEQELSRQRGYLAQRAHLEFAFSVLEVVLLGRTPHLGRSSHGRDCELGERAMELAGVSHLARRRYTELSGGERQRVQLARVLCQVLDSSHPLLILDEPTSSLDLRHQHRVLACARGLARDGATVVVVLHDLALASQYTDRALVMAEGRVLAHGASGEVLTPETVRRAFGVVAHRVAVDEMGLSLVVASGPDVSRSRSERWKGSMA